MAKITIQVEEDFGSTQTFSQEIQDIILVEDFFEACLAAYAATGYVNDVEITVNNSFLGDTVLTWDRDNSIDIQNPASEKIKKLEETLDALSELAQENGLYEKENWYMGHRY